VVLGAGGAARAVVFGLKKAGARVLVLNRTFSHAEKLAVEFKCSAGEILDFNGCDILINATSVGMKKMNETPLPQLSEFALKLNPKNSKRMIVMDVVYVPRMTKLLRDAKKAGCRIILGEKMLLAQAKKSFELFAENAKSPRTPVRSA
jgi:shikimate dehydrogenase